MNDNPSLPADEPTQPSKESNRSKNFFTIPRVVIYTLLLVFIVVVLNDRRIYEKANTGDERVYAAALAYSSKFFDAGDRTPEEKGETTAFDQLDEEARKKLAHAVTRPSRFRTWMKETYGLQPDPELSQPPADVFVFSSGIRKFHFKVRYNSSAVLVKYDRGPVGKTELAIYYFWQSPQDDP